MTEGREEGRKEGRKERMNECMNEWQDVLFLWMARGTSLPCHYKIHQ